jgi:voltage-gated potassium channel Kch
MPGMVVRWLGGIFGYIPRKVAVECWVLFKPIAWMTVLYFGWSKCEAIPCFVCFGLVDLYAYLLGLVFLRPFFHPAASHGRNVLLLGINLLEAIFGYAILYVHYGAIGTGISTSGAIEGSREALYFSVVTTTTVGYGDIRPLSSIGQNIAMIQMISSLVFITVIATSFISNLPQKSGHGKD